MASKFGFEVRGRRAPTPQEQEEWTFQRAKKKIVAILRDYNAARGSDLSIDPQTYYRDGELVIPQLDRESEHLARILHEQTGLDVRMIRRSHSYIPERGGFDRPTLVWETVKTFGKGEGAIPDRMREEVGQESARPDERPLAPISVLPDGDSAAPAALDDDLVAGD